MPFGYIMIPFILMNPQIELLIVLYHGCIQCGEQYMVFTIHLIQWTNKQAMILPGVASDNGGGGIRTCTV